MIDDLDIKTLVSRTEGIIGTLLLICLVVISQWNYLLFHTIAELFSVFVACGIFMFAWNSRRFLKQNQYLLLLGIAYLFIALLDLMHALTYKGMGIFSNQDADLATQLWIAARFTESISLLLAGLLITSRIRIRAVFIFYSVLVTIFLVTIFVWPVFPRCFIEGEGLTVFKKVSEYVISAIFLLAIFLIMFRGIAHNQDRQVRNWLVLSIVLTIASELSFTLYRDLFGLVNIIGHFLKLVSFYVIYKALIETGFQRPVHVLFSDLIDRERTLAESEERYRSLVELSPDVIAVHQDGRYVYINQVGLTLFGAEKPEDIIGNTVLDLVAPSYRSLIVQRVASILTENQTSALAESRILRLDGREVDIEATGCQTIYEGKPAVQLVMRDITRRKQVEEALKQAHNELESRVEQRTAELATALNELQMETLEHQQAEESLREIEQHFRIALEHSRIFVFNQDDQLRYTWLSNPLPTVIAETIVGMTDAELYAPADAKNLTEMKQAVLESKRGLQRELTLTGGVKPVSIAMTIEPLRDSQGKTIGITGAMMDISLRKQAEQDRHRLETAVENAVDSIVITDAAGRIIYVNAAFLSSVTGTKEDYIGAIPDQLWLDVNAEEFDRILRECVNENRRNTHSRIRVDRQSHRRDYEVTISPVISPSGALDSFVIIERDVTEHNSLERHVRMKQKMEAVGTIASGIAHDFNNILVPIIINTEMVQSALDQDSADYNLLELVLKAAQRGKLLVQQITAFSRPDRGDQRVLFLKPIIEETAEFLRASLPTTIQIVLELEQEKHPVHFGQAHVHQVLMNLCNNAAHALKDNGDRIVITLSNVYFDSNTDEPIEDLATGAYAKITVSDNGRGIPDGIIDRIFDPFFTTKKTGEGSGLGLFVVHGLIKGAGGAIMVDSEPDIGTTFSIYLPQIAVIVDDTATTAHLAVSGRGHILLVDDEIPIVQSIKTMLERLEYSVSALSSSVEALALFKEKAAEFDLIISDQVMPQLTGLELIERCRQIRPDFPAILCTGFSEHLVNCKCHESAIDLCIMKPFSATELSQAISVLLKNKQPDPQDPLSG